MNWEKLNNIGDKRGVLEEQIQFLIKKFEEDTGSYVKEIWFTHSKSFETNQNFTESIRVIVDDVRFDR